jgi:hypothetical protein
VSWTIEFLDDISTVTIVYEGVTTADDLRTAIPQAIELAGQKETRRFLCDCSRLVSGGSTLDIFEMAQMLEQIPGIHQYRDAIIMPANTMEQDELRFFETAARNRGINVRVFTDREHAIAWLTGTD